LPTTEASGGTPTRPAPRIQVGAPEVQLAADAFLLTRYRPLGCEFAQRIAIDAKVFGRTT